MNEQSREPALTDQKSPFSAVYRSAGSRATVVVALLATVGLIEVITAWHDFSGFDLIRQGELGTLTEAEATSYDNLTTVLAIPYIGAFLACVVAYLAWLSRSVDNVPVLTGERPSVTPGWSIGWWFIPLANLIRPYQIVRELLVRLRGSETGPTAIVLAWWLAWIAANVASAIVNIASRQPLETLDALRTWFTVNLVSDVLIIAAAVLAIIVVRRIQRHAEERATHLQLPEGLHP